jgi:hypothetical protein
VVAPSIRPCCRRRNRTGAAPPDPASIATVFAQDIITDRADTARPLLAVQHDTQEAGGRNSCSPETLARSPYVILGIARSCLCWITRNHNP